MISLKTSCKFCKKRAADEIEPQFPEEEEPSVKNERERVMQILREGNNEEILKVLNLVKKYNKEKVGIRKKTSREVHSALAAKPGKWTPPFSTT